MNKKPRKPREVPSNARVLVQALVDPTIKAWLERMAAERDMKAGPYLRSLLRWCMAQQVDVVVKDGKKLAGKATGFRVPAAVRP